MEIDTDKIVDDLNKAILNAEAKQGSMVIMSIGFAKAILMALDEYEDQISKLQDTIETQEILIENLEDNDD